MSTAVCRVYGHGLVALKANTVPTCKRLPKPISSNLVMALLNPFAPPLRIVVLPLSLAIYQVINSS